MTTRVYLSLGSNQGDKLNFINLALDSLRALGPLKVSSPFVSEPEGFESTDSFINVAVALDIESDEPFAEADAIALLDALQAIEKSISTMPHRNPDGSYRNREIDIDIIEIPGLTLNTPRLTLPHPRAATRQFVQIPLKEVKN